MRFDHIIITLFLYIITVIMVKNSCAKRVCSCYLVYFPHIRAVITMKQTSKPQQQDW